MVAANSAVKVENFTGEKWARGKFALHGLTFHYAHNWLFFLVERGVVTPGASTLVLPVATTQWHYWLTFETYTEAAGAAWDWQTLGFETDIRAVFGGYYIDNLFEMYRPSIGSGSDTIRLGGR